MLKNQELNTPFLKTDILTEFLELLRELKKDNVCPLKSFKVLCCLTREGGNNKRGRVLVCPLWILLDFVGLCLATSCQETLKKKERKKLLKNLAFLLCPILKKFFLKKILIFKLCLKIVFVSVLIFIKTGTRTSKARTRKRNQE